MGGGEIIKTIGESITSDARVANVFGEPVTAGDRTIIPVARLSHAFFGAGGGSSEGVTSDGAGGGYLSASPAGLVEITETGTRFISFFDVRYKVAAIAIGIGIGLFLAGRSRRD